MTTEVAPGMNCADVSVTTDPVIAGRVDVGCQGPLRTGRCPWVASPRVAGWQPDLARNAQRRAPLYINDILPKPEKREQLPSFSNSQA